MELPHPGFQLIVMWFLGERGAGQLAARSVGGNEVNRIPVRPGGVGAHQYSRVGKGGFCARSMLAILTDIQTSAIRITARQSTLLGNGRRYNGLPANARGQIDHGAIRQKPGAANRVRPSPLFRLSRAAEKLRRPRPAGPGAILIACAAHRGTSRSCGSTDFEACGGRQSR